MSIIRKEQLSNPLSASYALTASYVENIPTINTSSLVTTSSFNAFTSSINAFTASYNTGSFSGSFTGSFNGTASWAESASQAVSSSYALTASYTLNVPVVNLSGYVTTSSFNNFTSSYNTGSFSGSLTGIASTASYYIETDPIFTTKSASLATTGSNTFIGDQTITGSLFFNPSASIIVDNYQWIFGSDGYLVLPQVDSLTDQAAIKSEGDIIIQADGVQSWRFSSGSGILHAPGGIEATSFTGSLQGTASWAESASQALTASYAPAYLPLTGGTINGNVTVTGTASVAFLYTTYITSSVIYSSGSNQFGDDITDTQTLYGTIIISGSQQITGSLNAPNITGSLYGTSSWAESASQAVSSSYAFSSSYTLSSSYALSASYALSSSYAQSSSYSLSSSYASTATSATQASDIILTVLNQTGTQINKGTVVRITGSNNASDTPRIGIADWTNDNLSANTIGLVMSNIANGATGSVLTEGIFIGYDTDTPGWTSGQLVFLGANGTITGSAPQAPLHGVRLGQVIRVQSQQGSIYVRIDNGYELDELHDVKITSPTNGNLLVRSSSIWINSNQLTGSYGLTGSLTATSLTGSLFGTSSWAESASQALTASYISTLYSSNFTASFGSSTTWTINHNLNTRYVIVQTFDSNHNQLLPQDITLTNANTATATFSAAESGYAVVTVGGALLNYIAASGNNGQVQYNNNGVLGGSSNFTFDGTYTELYGGAGYKALSTLTSDYYTTTELLNNRLLSTAYVTNFTSNEKFAGDVLEGGVSGTAYDLIYLDATDTWLAVDQTDSTKATRILGIYNGNDAFIEGYVVVGENGVASNVPLIAGTLTPGAPVYIKESATSAPFLDTTVPTSGVVRILGHLIRNEGSGYWFMKFRPDHTWITI